jgi:hypothetical protein
MSKIETAVVKPETSYEGVNLINKESEEKLDNSSKAVIDYIIENNGKGKTNKEKDNLYLESQKLWRNFITELKNVKYNFALNKSQHKFITDLVLNKLEYDVNTVFFAIELKELFETIKDSKYTNEEDLISFEVTATEITYIYHLISKHTIKGLTKDSYLFSQVLVKIGNISKIFNYYDNLGKNSSSDIQDWVLTFEEGVSFENRTVETVDSKVLANS